VEYRLAPEHKWPAGVDDAEAAARWVAENGAALGFEVTGLVLCGDSAGGSLALITTMALRDRPAAVPVVLTIPLYPVADEATVYPSVTAFSQGHGLDGSSMAYFHQALAWDLTSPRATPLLGEMAGLPPMVLATAECDPLRDSGRAFAAKAILAGVDVHYYEARGTIHGFATYRLSLESARADLAAIMAAAKVLLGGVMMARG
jgi:acetyl esterase